MFQSHLPIPKEESRSRVDLDLPINFYLECKSKYHQVVIQKPPVNCRGLSQPIYGNVTGTDICVKRRLP